MNNIQFDEGNIYDDLARKYGFKPYRQTGKHPVYRDPQGNQITVATSGQSRGSGPKNFESQLRRLQGQSTKPETTSTSTTPVVKPERLSSAQRRNQPSVKTPPSQQKLSFSDFAKTAYAAKDKVVQTVQPVLNTAQRQASAWKQNVLKNLDPKELVRVGNETLSKATGATKKGLKYVPDVDRPVPRQITFSGGRGFSGGPGGGSMVFNRLGR